MITTLLALATTSFGDHWQISASVASYVQVPTTTPSATVTVQPFHVDARPDGSLPLLQSHLSRVIDGVRCVLLKKQGDGTYRYFTRWYSDTWPGGKDDGILLSPGDYGWYVANPTAALNTTAVLSGKWVSPDFQADYWSAECNTPGLTIPMNSGGSAFFVFKFSVSARPDGKLPMIRMFTASLDGGPALYRMDSVTGKYDVVIDSAVQKTNPGILLKPGEYAATGFSGGIETPSTSQYGSVIATGRYVDP